MTISRTYWVALIVMCGSASAFAQETLFRVLGVRGEVAIERRLALPPGRLGEVTNALLNEAVSQGFLRQYKGSDNGIMAVNGMGSALEVLSDTQMNAYGWCYRVDGNLSNLLAHEYMLTGSEGRIEWFYAYAHLEKSEWTSMCVPADHCPVQE